MEKDRIAGSVKLWWITIFCVVAVVFIALGVLYYRYEVQRIQDDKYEDISAIAKLKADSLQDWRRHRLADVRRVPGPLVKKEIARLLQDPKNAGARAALQIQLHINRKATVYADALFLDTKGAILLSDNPGPAPVGQATMKAIKAALKDRREVLSDFFRDLEGVIYIDAVAPIPDNSGKPIAISVLRSKATDFLFPLIQAWPTPSRTAETLLVCRDGDSILFLNELRHRSNTALTLRFPLTNTALPAVQAVLGKEGRFHGRDYRGVEVLAILQPVPQSPWFIVAKVDSEEILAEVNYRAWVISTIVFLLILIAAELIRSVYQKQQEAERKQAAEALKTSEQKYRALLEHAADAIMIADFEGNFLEINKKAEELLGYTRDELLGINISQVHPKEELERALHAFRGMAEGRVNCLVDTKVLRKDGETLPVDITGTVVEYGGKRLLQGIVRDITDRKYAEELIKASLREKEILLKEIQHRVKNNLLTISGILALQSERTKDSESKDAFITCINRIKTMTKIHTRLYQSEDFSQVSFKGYIEELVWELSRSYGFPNEDIITDINDIFVDINTAIPIGLIVNELVSNAMKHAFPIADSVERVAGSEEQGAGRENVITVTLKEISGKKGTVSSSQETDLLAIAENNDYSLTTQGPDFMLSAIRYPLIALTVSDNGIGLPYDIDLRNTESLGLLLIVQSVKQINGNIELQRENGTQFIITFSVV